MASNKGSLKLRREMNLSGDSRTLAPLTIPAVRGESGSSPQATRACSQLPCPPVDIAALEQQARNMGVSELRKELVEDKVSHLTGIKTQYEGQLYELFFLQSGGNMMDFLAWKKKPNKARDEFMATNRLDEDDYGQGTPVTADVADRKSLASAGLPTGAPTPTKAPIARKDISRTATATASGRTATATASAGVQRDKFFPSFPPSQPATPAAVPLIPVSAGAANIRISASPAPSTAPTMPVTNAYAMTSPMPASGPEEDPHERHIVKRISDIHNEGLWPSRRLPVVYEPPQKMSTWDYLLREAEMMAVDFAQERRWKMEAAKMVSTACYSLL